MNATERARRSDALYRDDAKMHRRDLCDMVAQREAENERLRELVRLMWKPFCWAQSGCEVCLKDEQDAEIRDKIRELEVEVDE